MMRSIVLSGFMGSGKSTVGPIVAARLGAAFVDTDAEIERAAGRPIAELWAREGEATFRAREAAIVERVLADGAAKVVAFGGGTVMAPRLRRLAIDRALVVTLTAAPETIVARVGDPRNRPNLAIGVDPLARASDLLAFRAEAYSECHMSIATDALSPALLADAVVKLAARDPLLVPLGARSYAIDVCLDEPARLAEAIARLAPSSVVLVTDANVQAMRGQAVNAALAGLAAPVISIVLAPGEANKTLAGVASIWDAALRAKVDRDTVVVAAGGGVVGDLAGFAAACLLRGVRFIQVPTTVLAMVDSSVGGKTGFDHPAGKNLVGAFHQPNVVVADLAHLETLSAGQRLAGLAEVVKIALATDEAFLGRIEAQAAALSRGDVAALTPVVRDAIMAKIRVVRDDEREHGARALLNLGHTVGHALEAYGGYGRWLHGEAVALGTVIELQATAALGFTEPAAVDRCIELFASLGLPTAIDSAELAAAWPFVESDKKRGGGALRLPVVTSAGCAHVERVQLTRLRDAVLTGQAVGRS